MTTDRSASEKVSGGPSTADLEFGIFDWLDLAEGRSVAETYESRLALARRADESNFTRYHLAEHHGTPLGLAPSPAVFLAALARETSRLRLAATTFIIPLYEPLRLVQEIAMLDQLSAGRLEIGVGKGSSPHEAAMFGFTPAEAAERYEQLLPAILDALGSGQYRSPARQEAEPVDLFVRPLQRPHPPLWYPTSNPASIPRLAELGYHTIFGFGFVSPPLREIREHSRTFFETRGRLGDETAPAVQASPRFGMLRHVFVGETDAEAMAVARAAFAAHYASFTYLWRKAGSDRFAADLDLDELVVTDRFLVGSPDTVSEQLSHAVRTAEVNYFAGAFAWGTLSAQDALRSVDLFDREVIPQVRSRLAGSAPEMTGAVS